MLLALCVIVNAAAEPPPDSSGTISGMVIDASSDRPVLSANVVVHALADSSVVTGGITDQSGTIAISGVPPGRYFIRFGMIGYEAKATPPFVIDDHHRHLNLGTVALTPAAVSLDEVLVAGERSLYSSSFDRKVYNADKDIMSKAASVSELLQSVPSVAVDIDGTVSLRGSTNVRIMVDGKTSALMDKSSAVVLEQMPASSIDKIEVITNPSAKYKPDAEAGIINIVTKKNSAPGINGDFGGNAGNQDRYNANLRINCNPGAFNAFGTYAIRKDSRNRISSDNRRQVDSSGAVTRVIQGIGSYARPLSHLAGAGVEFKASRSMTLSLSANYQLTNFTRTDENDQALFADDGSLLNRYARLRDDAEYEREFSATGSFERRFTGPEDRLRVEYTYSNSPEQEDNHYSNIQSLPVAPETFDNILITNGDRRSQVSAEYTSAPDDQTSIEAGYSGEFNRNDFDFEAAGFDAVLRRFVPDRARTNRFLYEENINAVYLTFGHAFGNLGFQGGLRAEYAGTAGNLVTMDSTLEKEFFNLFPSLHLSYRLSPAADLQLSYSRRIHRPETEDLNPFPEYRDPRNYTAGNPNTLPEYIHQVEFGCQFQNDRITAVPALYFRKTLNRFTTLTTSLNDTLLLTTRGNLASDQSGGLEIVLSANLGMLTAHWSGNAFLQEIDASNLGYAGTRSTTSWSSNLTLGAGVGESSRMQVNANYHSVRLTPQGEISPGYVVNTGFRQDFMERRLSLIVTVADIFKSLKRELTLTTPVLDRNSMNTRDARIIYVGVTYHFGIQPKKSEDEPLKYDDKI